MSVRLMYILPLYTYIQIICFYLKPTPSFNQCQPIPFHLSQMKPYHLLLVVYAVITLYQLLLV
jgi:hypothetical protein